LRIGHTKLAALRLASLIGLAGAACPSPTPAAGAEPAWRTFEGTWTAVGQRTLIPLGGDRRGSITDFSGSLVLRGASRPGVGFRAHAVVLNDSVTGMIGRAVWTDAHGDQVYSELAGPPGPPQTSRIVGKFIGGSGRYVGATGAYAFSWRFLLEAEDGTVQGQSLGLKGQVRTATPGAAAPTGRPPP
jgi:hypothetical protein